jgi:O-antigen/teichoic acid export membrane protein
MNFIKKIIAYLNKSSITKNFSIVLVGDGVASLFSFLNVILITRTIGLAGVGMLTIVQTYSNTFNQIFSFQSYFAVTKYVTESLEKKDNDAAKQYIKQGFLLDIITSLLALTIGFFALEYVNHFFHWDQKILFYIKLYLITFMFNFIGTAQAIIRTFDKFKFTSYINILGAFLRTILYLFGFIVHKDIFYFVITEILIVTISNVLLMTVAYRILKENKLNNLLSCKTKFDMEFLKFNLYNNLITTLDLPVGQLTTLFINKYLGFKEVGIYNIIQRFGSVFLKLSSPLSQVVYPELTKHIAKKQFKNAFNLTKKIFVSFSLLGVSVLVVLTIFVFLLNDKLMKLLGLTIDYHYFYILMAMYIVYLLLSVSFIGLHELFIAIGFVSYNIPIVIVANSIYLFLLFTVVQHNGLIGLFTILIIQIFLVVLPKIFIIKKNLPLFEKGDQC